MSQITKCVISTNSKKERKMVFNFVKERGIEIPFEDEFNGSQLLLISDNSIGYIGVMVARHLVECEKIQFFHSINEFFDFYNSEDE